MARRATALSVTIQHIMKHFGPLSLQTRRQGLDASFCLRSVDSPHSALCVICVTGCSVRFRASLGPPNEGTQGDLQITELQDG